MRRWWSIPVSLLVLLAVTVPAHAVGRSSAGIVLQLAGTTPGHIFAGLWCGVYELSPDRATWTEVAGMRDIPARQLLRLQNDVLLANPTGWFPGGFYRHVPGGAWQPILVGYDGHMATNPLGTRVYAFVNGPAGGPRLLRSDDSGANWTTVTNLAPSGRGTLAVTTDPVTGDDVLIIQDIADRSGRSVVRMSRDGGLIWTSLLNDPTRSWGTVIAADSTGAYVYIAGTEWGIMSGSGTTHLLRLTTHTGAVDEIALPDETQSGGIIDILADSSSLIVGGSQAIFASPLSPTAAAWTRYDQGLGGARLFRLLTTAPQPNLAAVRRYAATATGVYQRDPADTAWQPSAAGLPACSLPGRTVYDPIPPFPDGADHQFFPTTQHSLSYGFKSFWEHNGGLPVFGAPLTEEFDEQNTDLHQAFITQYLERERFEYHPENVNTPYAVLLGRLGAELLAAQGRDWRQENGTANPFPANDTCQEFNPGGLRRSVCGPFLSYWQHHGLDLGRAGITYDESLALFGFPLTAPKMETNPDGDTVLTQWFERARFEYHPDKPEPFKVLLGRLGAESLDHGESTAR